MGSLMLVKTNDVNELEIELTPSSKPRFPNTGVLIIHPYSGLGGSMHDFVVEELHRQLVASQDFSLVMRYNQRGVGRSKGRRFSFKNLRGEQDAADVIHMIEFLSQRLTSPDSKSVQVIVIGYSFGACLASYALQDPRVALYIGISFPLGGVSSLLKTKQAFDSLCKAAHVPRLLVLGAQDQYTKVDVMEEAMKLGGGLFIAILVVCLSGQALAKPEAAALLSVPELCGNYIPEPGFACEPTDAGEPQALEVQNVQTSVIYAAGGDNKMTYDEFITYPSQVGVYSLNTPRNLQFSSNCFFKSPSQPLNCTADNCVVNMAIPELNDTTWGELAANECAAYYPVSSTPVALGPAPNGTVLISVIGKCQNITFTSPQVYQLTDEWGNEYIMHASGGNTTEAVAAAAANAVFPKGWSVKQVKLTEPLTIYPNMQEDGNCYYTIARDSQDNSYHMIGCGGTAKPTDYNTMCPAATMSAAGKAKKAAAPSAAPTPGPTPSSASRVLGAASVVAAAFIVASGF